MTDESKFNKFGSNGKTYVRRRTNEEFNKRCIKPIKPTVKGGSGFIMVWGAITMNGVVLVHKIQSFMDHFIYLNIVKDTLKPFGTKNMRKDWVYQTDDNPKHTAQVIKQYLEDNKINIMKWSAQSLGLNPIQMLWIGIDKCVKQRKQKNIEILYTIIQETSYSISEVRCQKLFESIPYICAVVLRNKGLLTKY